MTGPAHVPAIKITLKQLVNGHFPSAASSTRKEYNAYNLQLDNVRVMSSSIIQIPFLG